MSILIQGSRNNGNIFSYILGFFIHAGDKTAEREDKIFMKNW